MRPYWSTLTSEKAAAPEHQAWEWAADPFAAKKEVEERQRRRREKEAVHEAEGDAPGSSGNLVGGGGGGGGRAWEGVPEVRMAPRLREMVEGTVRKVRTFKVARAERGR